MSILIRPSPYSHPRDGQALAESVTIWSKEITKEYRDELISEGERVICDRCGSRSVAASITIQYKGCSTFSNGQHVCFFCAKRAIQTGPIDQWEF